MLVGRTVKDYIRSGVFNYVVYVLPVFHIPDNRNHSGFFADPFLLQDMKFPVNLHDGVFAMTEKVQPFSPAGKQLPCQFRTDGTAGTGNEHPLSPQIPEALVQRNNYGSSPQNVQRVNFPGLYKVSLSVNNLAYAGQNLYAGKTAFFKSLVNQPYFFSRSTGNGNYGFVKGTALYKGSRLCNRP